MNAHRKRIKRIDNKTLFCFAGIIVLLIFLFWQGRFYNIILKFDYFNSPDVVRIENLSVGRATFGNLTVGDLIPSFHVA